MWLWLALLSAILLGFYDIAKKKALSKNGPLEVLLAATAISTLLLSPCFFIYSGPWEHHLMLIGKAVLVSASWVSGMIALKLLPITTVSTLKASRPFIVLLLSILIYDERLSALQYLGVALALVAVVLITRTGKSGDRAADRRGYIAIAISILTGVASALYDKHIMASMEPLFVQSRTNLYITAILAVWVAARWLRARQPRTAVCDSGDSTHRSAPGLLFRPDWWLPVTALLITGADMAYFFALGQEGSLLSVISIMRRASVIVTFVFGVIIFKEKKLGGKFAALGFLVAALVCLMLG